MGTKRQRKIAPYFQTHPPFNPVTGQYASFTGELGVSPYCVLMQIAAEDTYDDYVICRGFDTRILVFVDYEAGNPDKPGISVAKPYGKRTIGTYTIGEIYPALLPVQGNATYTPPSPEEIGFRLGQNPGVVDGTPEVGGQPSDLTASLALLYDHNDLAVNWMLIDSGQSSVCKQLPPPGSYPAVAGESIVSGATGSIVYDGAIYQSKNQSRCDVLIGHEVGFHVYKREDGSCDSFFVPCNCCDTAPPDCCDKMYNVCIAGTSRILGIGEAYRTCWPTCCITPEGLASGDTESTYQICGYISCDEGTDESTFHWTLGHPGTPHLTQGELNLGQLCVTGSIYTNVQPLDVAYPLSCDYSGSIGNAISVQITEGAEGCNGCGSCCDKRLWFCINGDSVELPLYGGSHAFDVTDCCPSDVLASQGITLVQIVIQTGCSQNVSVAGFLAILRLWKGASRYGPDEYLGNQTGGYDWVEALTPFCEGSERLYFQLISPCPYVVWGECCNVGVHVSEEEYSCVGCTSEATAEACCTKFLWFCINGNSQQLSVNGGSYDFDVTECCEECVTAELRITCVCNQEAASTLSLNWSYWCDGVQIDAGSISMVEFCTSNDPVIYNFFTLPCFLQLQVSIGNLGCDACTSSDPCADPADCVSTGCCVDDTPKALTMTIVGGVHAGTHAMTYDGVTEWNGSTPARLSCDGVGWRVDFNFDTYTASGCVPLTFDVSGSTEGITSLVIS